MAASKAHNVIARRAVIALWLLLVACLLSSCRTVSASDVPIAGENVVDRLYLHTLDAADVIVLDDRILPDEQMAMEAWLMRQVGKKHRMVYEGSVLTLPGFTQWEALESKADHHMQDEWRSTRLPLKTSDSDPYRIFFWKMGKKDYYFALVMTRGPVAGQDGRMLAGYCELRDSSAPLAADVLAKMQRWATPTPPDRLLPAHEHANEKTAMARWLERYLNHNYRIVRQRFVLTEPGFTQGAAIRSQANQYVQSTLGGVQKDFMEWPSNEYYQIIAWNVGSDRKQHLIAMVQTRDFVPGTNERTLIGYFHLSANDDE